MAAKYADELTAFKNQVMALLERLDTGGPVDQFQSAQVGDMRRRPPDPHLVGIVRALVPVIQAIDAYLLHRAD